MLVSQKYGLLVHVRIIFMVHYWILLLVHALNHLISLKIIQTLLDTHGRIIQLSAQSGERIQARRKGLRMNGCD